MHIATDLIEPKFFKKILDLINNDPFNLDKIERICKLLKNKYPSHILIGLHKLEFSAFSELSNFLNTDNSGRFRKHIGELVRAGIIIPVTKSFENYEFILKFWTTYYIHSPKSNPPAFYRLHSSWIKIIESLQDFLSSGSFGTNSIDMIGINKRMDTYKDFCFREKADFDAIEDLKKNSIGQCQECKKYIRKNSTRGKDYHKYPIGLICNLCNKKANDRTKWMHANK